MFWRKMLNQPELEPMAQRSPNRPEADVVAPPEAAVSAHDSAGDIVWFADNGDIHLNVNSVAEAKLAIKQLKLQKKDVALQKRRVQQEITGINAQRRDQLARQGRMPRGGGGLGRTVRAFEGFSRDQQKAQHEQRLGPYQAQKARLESYALHLDKAIHHLETYILQQGD